MSTSFPTGIDSLTNPTATDKLNNPSHSTQHANANDAIEALEAKVGVDGSAVTTSHDYKLSGITGSGKAALDSAVVHLAGTETITGTKTFNAGTFRDKGSEVHNVKAYGAVGDGTTDDSSAIQTAIAAVIAAGGGTLLFPQGATYKIVTGLSFDPATLTMPVKVLGYGAKLDYTGSADAITVLTNIAAADVQHAERSFHFEGLKISGTSSASSAIRNKASFTTFKNIFIENFTATASQKAAIVMDAMFHFWVEECHFDTVEIYNTGNGICFLSRDDSGGTAASIANNNFTNVHIWLTQAGGTGIYGVGLGASTLVQVSRSVFSNIIIHLVNVANLTAFDLRKCYVEGTVFLAPGVDVFGTAATSTGWSYTFSEILTVLGPTFFPLAGVTTKFTGGGKYFITGGNVPSTLSADSTGQLAAPSISLSGNINDSNGNEYFTLASSASAVNQLRVTNAATLNYPTISATGDDAAVGMYIYPKGDAAITIADKNVNEVIVSAPGVALAVNETTFTNAATGNKPSMQATGGDTNIGYDISSKGTGAVTLWSGAKARELAIFPDVASAINQVQISPSAAGTRLKVEATGDDTDISMDIISKGTGTVKANNVDVVTTTGSQTLTNKTLTTPTIGSFTNAAHDHTNAAGGGQLTDAALSAAVTASKGGTGQAGGYAVGDILYASGASTLSKLADVATGNALISGGVTTAPSYGKIGLTTHVSGTLPVANGGSNAGTMEQWMDVKYTSGNYTTFGNHTPLALGNGSAAYFEWVVPAGFTAISTAHVIIIPDTTETIQWDVNTDCGAIGQAYNNRTDSVTDATQAVTVNVLATLSLASALDGITVAAGDVVGIKFTSNTDFLFLLGLRIRYT